MTIYDLKLYGAYFPRLAGDAKVTLADRPEGVLEKAPREYRFEVELLKQYGSKQDVLELQYLDGRKEYVTLYEPTMYLEDGEWHLSENGDVAEAFLKMYELLKEKKTIDSAGSIFDLKFYGLQEEISLGVKHVEVFLFRVQRDSLLSDRALAFTATVLKEYKTKKYVVKAVTSEGEVCYIPLFDTNIYYDEKKRKWKHCSNKIAVPEEILKCYIKYLNE